MTLDEAHKVLEAYATGREGLDEAVRTLHAAHIPQKQIAALAGLSRDGVRKIVARPPKQTDQKGERP